MPKPDVVRAWKDEDYCNSLTDMQRAMLPPLYTLDTFCQSLMFSCITLGCTITIGISDI